MNEMEKNNKKNIIIIKKMSNNKITKYNKCWMYKKIEIKNTKMILKNFVVRI